MSVGRTFECMAAMASLPQACAFVEHSCAEQGVDPHDALRLALLVEELFTNTVVHGHGGDCDAPVRLELRAEVDGLTLVFADRAPPFDPLTWTDAGAVTVPAALEDRPVGRLGIRLVAKMSRRAVYERIDGWNRLRLDLDRRA